MTQSGGGLKHLFLNNSLKFPKKWGGGAEDPPCPSPPRAIQYIVAFFVAQLGAHCHLAYRT